jgi:hypothetical protein
MPDELPINTHSRPTPEDINLYCLECGYNLRGLSGDPRRCPECGYKNPVGDLEIPAPLITQQLKKMETAPTMCLASIVFAGLIGFALYRFFQDGGLLRVNESCFVYSFFLLFCSAVVYFGGILRFRDSCSGRPGWGMALLWYHVYGLITIASIPLFIGFGVWAVNWIDEFKVLPCLGFMIFLIGLFVFVQMVGRWARPRAVKRMQPLQREVALEIARAELRKRMRQGGRGPFG